MLFGNVKVKDIDINNKYKEIVFFDEKDNMLFRINASDEVAYDLITDMCKKDYKVIEEIG